MYLPTMWLNACIAVMHPYWLMRVLCWMHYFPTGSNILCTVHLHNTGNTSLSNLNVGYMQHCDGLEPMAPNHTATCLISFPVFQTDFDMWSEFGSPVNLTILVYQYGTGDMPVVVAATSVAVPLVAETEVGVLVSTVVVPPGAAQGKDCVLGSIRLF